MDSDGSENEDVNDEEEDHQTKQKNCPNKSWYFIHHSTIKGKRFSAYSLLSYTYLDSIPEIIFTFNRLQKL